MTEVLSSRTPSPELDRQNRYGLRPPRRALRYLEARVVFELASLVSNARQLRSEPRGDGSKVVLMPGFLADEWSMWPLQKYLSVLGYDAQGWGLGRNEGDPEAAAERFLARLDSARQGDEQVTLIGWSLGGVVARLVAMQRRDRVREVITLGTPVEGGPKYTAAGTFYAESRGIDLDAFEQRVHALNQRGLDVPLTVVYSRSDGIVSWRAAIDRYNPHAKHVEVSSSHVGLGLNPDVWRIIAQALHASRDVLPDQDDQISHEDTEE